MSAVLVQVPFALYLLTATKIMDRTPTWTHAQPLSFSNLSVFYFINILVIKKNVNMHYGIKNTCSWFML
jgi:hypothetical protein